MCKRSFCTNPTVCFHFLYGTGLAAACSMFSMVSYNLVTTSTLGLAPRLANSDAIMLQRTSHSHLQYSHLQSKQDSSCISTSLMFYVSYGCWPTYFNLVGVEEDIANERFKWSRASTFSYNRNAIGLAVAYASAIRTHLSVHDTAHPMSAASIRPRSAADWLIRSAVNISHPRRQGTPPASSSAVNDSVRSDIFIGFGTGTVGGGGWQSFAGY